MSEKAQIFYKDIGDYLSREEKLRLVSEGRSILNPALNMTEIKPNKHGDWISFRNDAFSSFIAIGDKESKNTFWNYGIYCRGLETSRDAWTYNSNRNYLSANIEKSVKFYNSQLNKFQKIQKLNKNANAKDYVDYDDEYISWSRAFISDVQNGRKKHFEEKSIVTALYHPFFKQYLYFNREMNNVVSRMDSFFPTSDSKNFVICISSPGDKVDFSCYITNFIPDLHCIGTTQCFPLYWYEKKPQFQNNLFHHPEDEYIRRDAISDFILDQSQTRYGPRVAKEDVFYYVYGLLHCPEYRKTFANDLKKTLPRLPLVEKPADFWAFSEAGRRLADLHLNYEEHKKLPDVTIAGIESKKFIVDKMRFGISPGRCFGERIWNSSNKNTIIYNRHITVSNIPEKAYNYIVNGKSAIEWVMERYAVSAHKESGITNNPNDWAAEHGSPRYILDLLLSVISVSVQTVDIVAGLPKVEWE